LSAVIDISGDEFTTTSRLRYV